jgi:hypothetical protein
MGIITVNNVQAITFNLAQDTAAVSQVVNHLAPLPLLHYVFVGESHDFAVDRARRNEIVDQFKDNARIILVSERAMKYASGNKLENFLQGPNHPVEPETELKSAEAIRNIDIVSRTVAESSKDPATNRRLVLIMFGGDHEDKIKDEVKKQTPSDEAIGWWYFPSIYEQIGRFPDAAFVNQAGYSFIGFTGHPSLESLDSLGILLLLKGQWNTAFTIEVKAGYMSPDQLGKRTLYAVYGRNADVLTQQKITEIETSTKGSIVMPVNSAVAVRLVLMQNDQQYQALK